MSSRVMGVLAGLLVACSLVLTACAERQGPAIIATPNPTPGAAVEPVRLRFATWAALDPDLSQGLTQAAAEFQALHPHITIEIVPIPFNQARTELLKQAAARPRPGEPAGGLPDVVHLSGWLPQELGGMNLLRDLNGLAPAGYLDSEWPGALPPGALPPGALPPGALPPDSQALYAVPLGLGPHALWWNKALFAQAGLDPERPPATMDELAEMAAALRASLPPEAYPLGLDLSPTDYAVTGFWPWILTYGGRPLYDGRPHFDTPETGQAFAFLQNAAAQGWTPTGAPIVTLRERMAASQIAMKLDGPYLAGILRSLDPALAGEALTDQFGVAPVPSGTGAGPITLADLHLLGIAASSQHPEEAWAWIEFLTSTETGLRLFVVPQGLLPPLQRSLSEYPDLVADPVSQVYIQKVLPGMQSGPYGPAYGAAQQEIIHAMQAVGRGQPVPETLSELSRDLGVLVPAP